uniref:CapA family protein n=1 Tax=Flavobacterium sp. TaxID=239 RepID=UPI00404A4B73
MKTKIILLILFVAYNAHSQKLQKIDSLSFVFIGDIMGHEPQINAAFDKETNSYNYDAVFDEVAPIIKNADFAIANLEVTLAGKPFSGYPQFSSPDALAVSAKNSGIDVLVTSNNHSCDRGKKGILRTIQVLDSLKIQHTGTFKDSLDRVQNNLLVLSKNNIKVGLLNYTYGTNGIETPKPTFVNRIDTTMMLSDIKKAQNAALDKLIVVIHWGEEYQSQPSKNQTDIAEFLFKNGVDIIVGSHPHVLQKMEYLPNVGAQKERLIAYSLGNFVSNQRTRKRDGGAIFQFTIVKRNNKVNISSSGYYLTWVNKPLINDSVKFQVIPCGISANTAIQVLDADAKEKMDLFLSDSRALFDAENINVREFKTLKR